MTQPPSAPRGFAFPSDDHEQTKLLAKLKKVQTGSALTPAGIAEEEEEEEEKKEKKKEKRRKSSEEVEEGQQPEAAEHEEPKKKAKKTEEKEKAREKKQPKKAAVAAKGTLDRYFMPKLVLPATATSAADAVVVDESPVKLPRRRRPSGGEDKPKTPETKVVAAAAVDIAVVEDSEDEKKRATTTTPTSATVTPAKRSPGSKPKASSPSHKKQETDVVAVAAAVVEDSEDEKKRATQTTVSPAKRSPGSKPKAPSPTHKKQETKVVATAVAVVGDTDAEKKRTTTTTTQATVSPAKRSPGGKPKAPSPTHKKQETDVVAAAAAPTDPSETEKSPKKRKWDPSWGRGKPDRSALNPNSKSVPEGKPNCLSGLVFAITGRLESLGREEATELITRYAGVVQQQAGKKVTHVLAGVDGGESKKKAAKERNLKVVTEDELFEMIRTLPEKPDDPKRKIAKALKEKKLAPVTPHLLPTVATGAAAATTPSPSMTVQPLRPPSTTTTSDGLMWVDRYKPKLVREMIFANRSLADRLVRWLHNWSVDGKPRAEGKGRPWPAVLLSGAPGIGKTTLAKLACIEAGFAPLEFNASDTRSKKSIQQDVQQALSSRTITTFTSSGGQALSTGKPSRSALIMDEVDGMSAGDRGGVAEIIQLLKKTKVPVICICNDRQSQKVRALAKHCMDLRLERPSPDQLAVRLVDVAHAEGFSIATNAARRIGVAANSDIRQALNLLHMYSLNTRRGCQILVGDEMLAQSKDLDVTAFDVAPRMIAYAGTTLEQKLRWYYCDRDMLPLLIQENYLSTRPRNTATPHIQLVARAAEDISIGDVLSTSMRMHNQWHLSSEHAVMSCILPCHTIQGGVNMPNVSFPTWLGKTSTGNKNKRLVTELQTHMRLSTCSTSQQQIVMDMMSTLFWRVTEPLAKRRAEGIDEVVALMIAHDLTREDWTTIVDVSGSKPPDIESGVLSAFTRKLNAQSAGVIATAAASKHSGGDSTAATAAAATGERELDSDELASASLGTATGDEDYDDGVAAEEEEDDIKHDKLIQQRKTTTAKSPTSKRQPKKPAAKRASKKQK